MANSSSNTMELNSILAEARGRKNTAARTVSAQRGNTRSASAQRTSAQRTAAKRPAVSVRTVRSFDDDFVLTDDDYTARAPKKAQSASRPAVKKAPAKKKKKTGLIAAVCIVGVLAIAAIGGLTLFLTSGSSPEDAFADNVTVNGTSLKGMTMDQAKQAMSAIEGSLADGINVTVKAGDKTYNYTKDDFKYSFNTDAVLAEAKAYSEEKGLKTGEQKYEIKMTVSDATCSEIISAIAKDVKTNAKNAEVTDFDPSADSMFTVSDGQNGVALNEADSLTALTGFINGGSVSGTVDAKVDVVEPKFTAAYLKENIKKLSSFSTYSSNNANGNENMRVSLAACNGSIIEPGATWSFNDCTGDSNLESNGYKPAGVIIQGRSETGIGGGICQSSTTIYNAGILCGMDVVERECHYYKSVYADAGRDATVDYGNIDLKLSNPFDYQLFMKCWMDGTELNCEIYGLENPEFDDVEIHTTDPSYFDRGYRVSTSRTFLKDGSEVRSDDLPSSTYYTSAPSSGSSSSSDSGSSGSSDSGSSSSSDSGSSGDSGSSSTPDPEPVTPDPEPVTPDPDPEPVTPDPEPVVDPGDGE